MIQSVVGLQAKVACSVLTLLGSLAFAAISRAGIVVSMSESGPNVVATLSGSIASLAGATFDQTDFGVLDNSVRSDAPLLYWASGSGLGTYDQYNITGFPGNLGTSSNLYSQASSSTASTNMFVQGVNPALWIDDSYTLGAAVTGTLTWSNTTLSSLGIAPGSYVWSWTGDSVTLNVVPEPSTWMMALAGFACGGWGMYRRRRTRRIPRFRGFTSSHVRGTWRVDSCCSGRWPPLPKS